MEVFKAQYSAFLGGVLPTYDDLTGLFVNNDPRSTTPDTVHSSNIARKGDAGAGDEERQVFVHLNDSLTEPDTNFLLGTLNISFTGPATGFEDATANIHLMETDWNPLAITFNNKPTLDGNFIRIRFELDDSNGGTAAGAMGFKIPFPDGVEVFGFALSITNAGVNQTRADLTLLKFEVFKP